MNLKLALGAGIFIVFILLFIVFVALGAGGLFVNPLLLSALNFIFQSLALFIVAFISAKTYLKSGLLQLLLIGVGITCFGTGVLINSLSPLFVPTQNYANFTVTVHNVGLFVFSIFSLCAAISVRLKPSIGIPDKARLGVTLGLTYGALILFITLVAIATFYSVIPNFFAAGSFTLLRQTLLGLTLALFSISSFVLASLYMESKKAVLYWLSLALALYAIGVATIASIETLNTSLNWLGRVAQYTGSIFFVFAVLPVRRFIWAGGILPW